MQEMDSGDADAQAVPRLLEKLSGRGHVPSYYLGGLELLTQALAGCEWPLAEEKRLYFFSPHNLFCAPLATSPVHLFHTSVAKWPFRCKRLNSSESKDEMGDKVLTVNICGRGGVHCRRGGGGLPKHQEGSRSAVRMNT